MSDKELHTRFEEAVAYVNGYTEPLPADLLLKLYAYFKVANKNFDNPGSRTPLINAFKANALFQAQNMTVKEAKEKYIALVESEVKKL
ncbi:acyl-CoA-binding protein [Flagellimonas alvinocaridis]|jgi:acyl-CoA-binding protein|uniref:Acyl-CoA-binding protein n=1 Tax=Flagellimonas alvinocaridis TaxID=2530200 RepID=A0A4S8RQ22_9FLAO|nr:acyl-CoA-binding protein [Allomuricauda alvinocaridis]THV59125.1 acyl-CoA-binding protein [Allomuricauda alvinocaridis]